MINPIVSENVNTMTKWLALALVLRHMGQNFVYLAYMLVIYLLVGYNQSTTPTQLLEMPFSSSTTFRDARFPSPLLCANCLCGDPFVGNLERVDSTLWGHTCAPIEFCVCNTSRPAYSDYVDADAYDVLKFTTKIRVCFLLLVLPTFKSLLTPSTVLLKTKP